MKTKLFPGLALLLGSLALCGAGLWLLLSPPQYAATARIKLENDEPDSSRYISYGGYFPQVAFEIIQSQLVLSNVVTRLNLNEVWGRKYAHGVPLKYAECYAIIRNHLRLTPVRNTKLIDITYYSDDPKEAADVANAIGAGYKDYRNQSRKALLAKGIEVLQQQYQDEEKQISLQPTNSEQKLELHKLLAEKIEALKMEPTPKTVMVLFIKPAEPPKYPISTNRPLGAALLAVGLFPLLGGDATVQIQTMKSKLLLGLALVLGGGLVGCSPLKQSPSKTHFGEIPQNITKTIELEVPELKCLGATSGTSAFATAWNGGEEYTQAAFYLRKNPRYHPAGEFPREPATPLPYADMQVVIVLYPSAHDAQHQVHKSLLLRQAAFQPEKRYREGTLHQYCDAAGGVQNLIYQSNRFIVEIDCSSQGVEPWAMKVLDAVLTGIEP